MREEEKKASNKILNALARQNKKSKTTGLNFFFYILKTKDIN